MFPFKLSAEMSVFCFLHLKKCFQKDKNFSKCFHCFFRHSQHVLFLPIFLYVFINILPYFQYSNTVSRMKRRMKDMIDVTDKYAVVEIFDNINILNEASKDLVNMEEPNKRQDDERGRRSVVSLMAIPNDDVSKDLSSKLDLGRSFSNQETNTRTIRSLSDHLSVLRKTYLK